MTWFAGQIFSEVNDEVIKKFESFDWLRKNIYLLKDFDEDIWSYRNYIHNLPKNGLIVCREFCEINESKEKEAYEVGWFGEDALSWDNLKLEPEKVNKETVKLINDAKEARDEYSTEVPDTFLYYLKSMSVDCKSMIGYYSCSLWGGLVFDRAAWVFDGKTNQDTIFVFVRNEVGDEGMLKYSSGGKKEFIKQGDALAEMLKLYGVNTINGYFEPHTRCFNWKRFLLNFENKQ